MLSFAAAPAVSRSLPHAATSPTETDESNRLIPASAIVGAAFPGISSGPGSPTPMEIALFDLVNRDRALYGLAPLAFDTDLLALARERARAQRAELPLAHRDDSGQFEFAKGLVSLGVAFGAAGENLARVLFTDARAPEAAQSALMNSDAHRAIILRPRFERVAVGGVQDGRGSTVFVQIFVGPS